MSRNSGIDLSSTIGSALFEATLLSLRNAPSGNDLSIDSVSILINAALPSLLNAPALRGFSSLNLSSNLLADRLSYEFESPFLPKKRRYKFPDFLHSIFLFTNFAIFLAARRFCRSIRKLTIVVG